ncbi:MAG: transposase DNA-binding-containing protein [Armatimonadota bacterium]
MQIVRRLLDRPGGLITTVCDGPAEAQATYRWLSNPAVSPDALHAALRDATVGRLVDEPVVLAGQDSTWLDFSAHRATAGLGPTSGGPAGGTGHGPHLHSALAVSAEGVPLGLLHQQDWARDPAQAGCKHQRKQRPFEDKESYRWQQTVLAVEAAVSADKLLKRYHFVLKSGCQLETSQLHTLERLERLLVLCSALAVRLLWMSDSARIPRRPARWPSARWHGRCSTGIRRRR